MRLLFCLSRFGSLFVVLFGRITTKKQKNKKTNKYEHERGLKNLHCHWKRPQKLHHAVVPACNRPTKCKVVHHGSADVGLDGFQPLGELPKPVGTRTAKRVLVVGRQVDARKDPRQQPPDNAEVSMVTHTLNQLFRVERIHAANARLYEKQKTRHGQVSMTARVPKQIVHHRQREFELQEKPLQHMQMSNAAHVFQNEFHV